MGDLFPPFKGTEEGLSVLVPLVVFQGASIQDNQYAIGVHFGVAYTVPSSDTALEAHILNAELGIGEGETQLVNER